MNTVITEGFFDKSQWVCQQCGYNMIGEMPDKCPFCGAGHEVFMAWDLAEKHYRVQPRPVNNYVDQLLSVPKLGLEHAAYRIETANGVVWIDSPSVFNRELEPVNAILFTHHHFMGASNQYRRLWFAQVWLHTLDAEHRLAAFFDVDQRFTNDFSLYGIDAYHSGGHTPGFTFYIYREVLFICDYVFIEATTMQFNPYGPKQVSLNQAHWIAHIVKNKHLKIVCGYNYVIEFNDWMDKFESLIHAS
jgi:hypothetical protein